jgi:transcription termination/antitermination protein NusG
VFFIEKKLKMKNWYVVQLAAGNEQKVKSEIERRVHEFDVVSKFGEVLIPILNSDRSEVGLDPKDSVQLFPGYILVSFEPSDKIFHMISSIDKVVRFLGGNPPVSLTNEEYDKIVNREKVKEVPVTQNQTFDNGSEIDIIKGPFSGFVGTIQSIDDVKKRLTVVISIFGRLTPVDVSFDQVNVLK